MEEELYPIPGPSRSRGRCRSRGNSCGRRPVLQQHLENNENTNYKSRSVPNKSRQPFATDPEYFHNYHRNQPINRPVQRGAIPKRYPNNDNRNINMNYVNEAKSKHNKRVNQSQNKVKRMGFLTLEELVNSDVKDILTNVNQKKEAFFDLLNSAIDSPDMTILIMKLLSKICQSSFDQIKLKLLLDTCNSQFIPSLRNYLMDLPYCDNKSRNTYYWNNQTEFWKNFLTFCECIVILSPSIALNKCRSLIDATSKCCLEGLKERHNFVLSEEENLKLIKLRERLVLGESEKKIAQHPDRKFCNVDEEHEPPENFRELSTVPTRDDLVGCRPYVRANVVKGGYRDVEHYLDVQFRLLREDCFGPLREGIEKFIKDPTKGRYDNIRVFRGVKFVEPYCSSQKIGSVVELDVKTKKKFKNVNWSHSKIFIYGSLVLFTKDNCNSFIVATILDRDEKYLKHGMIPVSMVDFVVRDEIYNDDKYTMIESEVYFEPYYHVLKALQDPTFPRHITMQKYIIDVQTDPNYPSYIDENTLYTWKRQLDTDIQPKKLEYKVQDFNTWPTSKELQFNESQYEAFKTCLTQEFAVIQGPPGTGKTYLGLKVAKTLLKNVKSTGCLILLVCYTNHALDQFLEGISKVTKSIIRIGGQSRNETMDKFNLAYLRKSVKPSRASHRLFLEHKRALTDKVREIQTKQKQIDSIFDCVISYRCAKSYIPQSEILAESYKNVIVSGKDPLSHWLFEFVNYDLDETLRFISSHINEEDNSIYDANTDNDYERFQVDLDNLEIDFNTDDEEFQTNFSVENAEKQIKYLISQFSISSNVMHKRHLHLEIAKTRARLGLLQEMKNDYMQEPRNYPDDVMDDPTNINNFHRWMIYFNWTRLIANNLKQKIKPIQESLATANTAYEESRMIMDIEIIQNAKVVGMTTSGAARLRKLLQALAPPIVIVEEAAEVLEQHIITSLTDNCQHLILIGDHQQLRPSAASMHLAKHYKIEISLFERMIMNSVHSRRLTVQHRMRPEISALISPHIYPDLVNHPSVTRFPDVRGVTTNLFFFTHTHPEANIDDGRSTTNYKEGDLILQLANYIMQQGYDPNDVTILAAYSGQMFYMRQQRQNFAFLSKVKITVVDNYQGEESKIILLSLVRNNQETIGFLGTENRICVALSRAKEGFYIFGNIDLLKKKSKLWRNIAETLKKKGAIGTSIQLKCENHATQITSISTEQDFEKVPEGGCLLKCNYSLPCLHLCPLICHGYDRGHNTTKCNLKCDRIICELLHVCPLMCREDCQPCMILCEKKLLCGHYEYVFCHLDPAYSKIKCLTSVPVKLPDCGHEIKKSCYMDVKNVKCPIPCEFRVERCGHVCVRKCHVTDDPDHEKYLCMKPCVRTKKGCTAGEGDRENHLCNKRCYEPCDDCNVEVFKKRESCKHRERVACSQSPDEKLCLKKCARRLPCDHFCLKKCFEKCGDCKQKVVKKIPECGHTIKVECTLEATRALCVLECEKTLVCGHRCRDFCRQPCDEKKCLEEIPQHFDSPCGHKVKLPCNVFTNFSKYVPDPSMLLQYCRAPCDVMLQCGHKCSGDCSQCLHGRLHIPCRKRCSQINICGHDCLEPCNQLCPPCSKTCEVKCAHSRCPLQCGALCVQCQEPCNRACPHGRCSRPCGEECSIVPCRERCPLRLRCGHACRGLCGERCPDACAVCRPDTFPTDFLGDPFDDDTILVVLEDCGHIMDFDDLENLMNTESKSISLRACPTCRKPIINTQRYKDKVNRQFKNEINPIKERVYGNDKKIMNSKLEFTKKFKSFPKTHSGIYEDLLFADWKKAVNRLSPYANSKKKMSLLQFNMFFVYFDILEMISEVYNKFKQINSNILEKNLIEQNSLICRSLVKNVQKISQQQQMDIFQEIRRMHSILQFSKILGHPAYKSNKSTGNVEKAKKSAEEKILGWGVFNENTAMKALKVLQSAVKVTVVTQEERNMIIKALGAKAGSWYKCPNGHVYNIGACGGAMQLSKCIECKASVGGESHRLLSDNSHASEFDNSRFAAWSETANNMLDFEL